MYQAVTQAKLGPDLGAMLIGGWGDREGDLAFAVRTLKNVMGGTFDRKIDRLWAVA